LSARGSKSTTERHRRLARRVFGSRGRDRPRI